jgi:TonB family protein
MVSPKIIDQLNLAKKQLIDSLFSQGKAGYYNKDYETALNLMDRILLLDPEYQLAKEYRELSNERLAAVKETAPLSTSSEKEEGKVEERNIEEPENKIYHLSSDITPPTLVKKVDPQYPRIDRQNRIQGTVIIMMTIDKDGSVKETRVLRSVNERIDNEAVAAVKQWKYKPALLKGKPVAVYKLIGIVFKLTEE